MRKLVAALALATALGTTASAQRSSSKHQAVKLGTLTADTDLSDGASFTINTNTQGVYGFASLVLYHEYTNNAGTNIVMTCTTSEDDSTYFSLQSCAVASGNCTSTNATWTNAVSGDEDFVWRVDVLGFRVIKCTYTSASADSSDTMTVTGYMITQ